MAFQPLISHATSLPREVCAHVCACLDPPQPPAAYIPPRREQVIDGSLLLSTLDPNTAPEPPPPAEAIYDLFVNDTRVTRDHPFIASAHGKLTW